MQFKKLVLSVVTGWITTMIFTTLIPGILGAIIAFVASFVIGYAMFRGGVSLPSMAAQYGQPTQPTSQAPSLARAYYQPVPQTPQPSMQYQKRPAGPQVQCASCGAWVPQDAFCMSCGVRLAQPEKAARRFCARCGTAIQPGQRFCKNCGGPV